MLAISPNLERLTFTHSSGPVNLSTIELKVLGRLGSMANMKTTSGKIYIFSLDHFLKRSRERRRMTNNKK